MAYTMDYERQMQGLINAVDKTCAAAVDQTAHIVENSAEIIIAEQKRIISGTSTKLSTAIRKSALRKTGNGNCSVTTGYHSDEIETAPEGVVIEFGRPGKKRGGIDKLGRKIGKQEAIPHIRAGFDNKKQEACKQACEQLAKVVAKTWTSTE